MRSGHPFARLFALCIVAGLTLAGMALPFVGGVGWFAGAATDSFNDLPSKLDAPPPQQRSQLLAADGTPIASFFNQDRAVVPLSQISPAMQHAIVAIEDSRFFQHGALDLQGTLRAAATDVSKGGAVQGGSTLTQQYVKNVLLYSEHDRGAVADSLTRKLREARYAIGVERRHTKREILNGYLNIVYFGEGAYGVEAAARRYFGVHARDLTVGQSALLAGLVQSPTTYDPLRHPAAAKARRDVVLTRMAQVHVLPVAEAARLRRTGLGLHPKLAPSGCAASAAPFFCDYVQQQLLDDPALGPTRAARQQRLFTGGLQIHTTLDPKVQRAAQHAVDRVVPRGSRAATAIAVVRPGDGAVLALAVDRGYGNNVQKHQTRVNLALGGQSGFQAGSTFKMFTLAAALQQHVPLSLTFAAPHQVHLHGFRGCGGRPLGSWSPKNAEDGEGGTFGLVRATWESVNTYFAKLEHKIGVCAPWRLATRTGITEILRGTPPAQVPAFTLGADDTSPLQVAGAYAMLAARGTFCAPYGVRSIGTVTGPLGAGHRSECRRVLPRRVADRTTSILRGVIDGPDPRRTGASASIGRPAAGKTGTTDSFAAAWFTGFTPQLAASVWVGDPRGGASHPLTNLRVNGRFYPHVYGADLPAAVWRATMRGALQGTKVAHFHGVARHITRDRTAGVHRTALPRTHRPAPPHHGPATAPQPATVPGRGHGHGHGPPHQH
ncbi:MAG TPA: transglycosylase domain-containing protein [Mycobacteriales bacterium]|nr:transglycosylase domain-containing protein [Mycobacteriales bacterium]